MCLLLQACATARVTHKSRTAQEQLLLSNAVDQAIQEVSFEPFSGRDVFVEEKHLEGIDKGYVIWSVRQRLLESGAAIVQKADGAEIIIEIASGCVGTNSEEMFVGTTKANVPTPDVQVTIPEVRAISQRSQSGAVKIGLLA